MSNATMMPTSTVSAKYWSELKDLSNSVKLELITLLSSSIALSVSETSPDKGWTKSFAGRWQDDESNAKELAHSFLGAFSGNNISEDWKKEKEDYLLGKYADL